MHAPAFDLARLLAPADGPTFLHRTWEAEPLVITRGDPGYYSGLFSAADVDRVIAFTRPQFPGPGESPGGPPPAKTYVQGCLPDRQPAPAVHYPGVAEVRQVFAGGRTVVVRSMQHRWPAVAALCRSLEAVFHCPVHANLYLTPPRSQGFEPHIDTHEVFALQIDGAKHWRLYGPAADLPLADEKTGLRRSGLGPPREVVLAPGDLLYIPRGYAHEAFTGTSPSLHLTVGVNVYRWADLLREALASVARQDRRFRESVPPGLLVGTGLHNSVTRPSEVGPEPGGAGPAGTPAPDDAARRFQELLRTLAETARAEDALSRLADRFFDGLEVLPDGYFAFGDPAGSIGPETVLAKRPGAICRFLLGGDTAVIEFPGGRLGGPARVAPALRFIARADRFSVREMPELGDDAKLVLARRAVREGLLAVVPQPTPAPSANGPGRPAGAGAR